MTPQQKTDVQRTWKLVLPVADAAAAMFYRRLFEIDESTAALFRETDMTKQRHKLLMVLSTVVSGLDQLDRLLPLVRELGRRHAGYGVTPTHYESVGRSLLATLEQGLGEAWTPAVARAWACAYTIVAHEMRVGAAQAEAA
ncbi:MAG: globin family protein [Alphaproteobacteria bacterium]